MGSDIMSASTEFLRRDSECESGYVSGASSTSSLSTVTFTKQHLKFLNQSLSTQSAENILRWAKITLPNLFQSTAFGLTGLVTIDMLSKFAAEDPSGPQIDLIFLDTLYHFKETHALLDKVRAKYPNIKLHVYKPEGLETTAQFEEKYGEKLWESNDNLYDWAAKVEPLQRATSELSVAAMLTGRRRSQGAKRSDVGIIEVTDEGLVKLNPLYNWSFKDVKDYIEKNDVPYNELLDQGYKSVGDWHSTQPVAEEEDERAGRWKGQEKTECGIHNKKSKYALFLEEMKLKAEQEELMNKLEAVSVQDVTA